MPGHANWIFRGDVRLHDRKAHALAAEGSRVATPTMADVPRPRGFYGEGAEPWWESAACADADPSLFFLSAARWRDTDAKSLCAACPVAEPCLRETMAAEKDGQSGARSGIFGGLNPTDRARIAQQAKGMS